MARFRKRSSLSARVRFAALVAAISVGAFAVTLFAVTPDAPGRPQLARYVETRTTDQHFSGCKAARAAGRHNIPASDPSYRPRMDGDGDGLACEPYPGL